MKQPRSCGFLLVSGRPVDCFLLMEHHDRWDLPKGHVDPGESDMECALRELEEETGFGESELTIDPDFCFEHRYMVSGGRYGSEPDERVEKILRIYLAHIEEPRRPEVTEHIGFRWIPWEPPHIIQEKTIDPLLAELDQHLQSRAGVIQ